MGPSSSSSSDSDHQRQAVLSKIATNDGHGEKSPYFDGWKAYDNDPFHPTKNPNGVIQMGLSENLLSVDLIEEWIKRNPNASICTPEGVDKFKDTANFQDYHGLPEFRNAIALFMEKVRGGRVKFDPSRIVMAGGATGATETIAFCLADPGDAFLAPTPYYPGFDRDFSWRTGVQLVPVICNSSNKFKVTRAALEVAYKNAQEANIKVKGVLISSPTNPLGRIVDEDTLNTLVSFINEKNIHLVCDEIYSASVFSSSPKTFISISEIIQENPKCNKNLIHILYSLSKDMGLPGFRVGILYSYNDAIVNCARKMSSYGLVSTQTQHLIASMLSDNKFIEMFLEESSRRLSKRYDSFTRGLAKANIGCLESNAGLAFWMDLRKLLKEPTLEAEMELWKVIINDVKLNISPGSSFHCSEPGWFRVCFANMDDDTMEIALGRIQRFCLGGKEDMDQKAMKKQYWRQNLRLSFKKARLEEFSMAPDMILSPHSPLVSAKT